MLRQGGLKHGMKFLVNCIRGLLMVGVFVCVSGSSHLTFAQGQESLTEEDLDLARQYFNAGQFSGTLNILSQKPYPPAFRNDVRFLIGLSSLELAIRESDETLSEALLAQGVTYFHSLLVIDPSLVRVRLELARTFFFQEKDRLAKENFERVLAGNPPQSVQDNINIFLQKIKARRRLRLATGVSVIRDSNYNNQASDKTILFSPFGPAGPTLPFIANTPEPKSGFGVSLTGRADYRHPISENLNARASVSVQRSELPGKDFDQSSLDFSLGPEYQFSPTTDISLLGVAGLDRQRDVTSQRLGVRIQTSHILGPRTRMDLRFGTYERSYRDRDLSHLDSKENEGGVNLTYRLSPTMTLDGGVSLSTSNPNASDRNDRRTLQGTMGVISLLKNGLTLGLSGSVARTKHNRDSSLPPFEPVSVRNTTLQATLHHRDFTLFGFSPELILTMKDSDSSEQASDVKGNQVNFNFVRQF